MVVSVPSQADLERVDGWSEQLKSPFLVGFYGARITRGLGEAPFKSAPFFLAPQKEGSGAWSYQPLVEITSDFTLRVLYLYKESLTCK